MDRHEETAQAMIGAFRRENTVRGAWITSWVFLMALRIAARLMMAQNAATQASAVSSMASSLAEARNEVTRASDGAARDNDDDCMSGARILSRSDDETSILGRLATWLNEGVGTVVDIHPS